LFSKKQQKICKPLLTFSIGSQLKNAEFCSAYIAETIFSEKFLGPMDLEGKNPLRTYPHNFIWRLKLLAHPFILLDSPFKAYYVRFNLQYCEPVLQFLS
jgi:hypothetical protein